MKSLFLALLIVWGSAQAQVLTYGDSTASLSNKGISTAGITRSVGSVTSFKTYWWGPYDVSDCWSTFNDPSLATGTDTLLFQGYITGIVRYASGDTVLGRWKAYLTDYPYPPQTLDGASTTWDFNWNNTDSIATYKMRQACDFVNTKRDGYPVHSRYLINTVASDTVCYTNLFIALELDSTTGTPAAAAGPLDIQGFWQYHCVKAKGQGNFR